MNKELIVKKIMRKVVGLIFFIALGAMVFSRSVVVVIVEKRASSVQFNREESMVFIYRMRFSLRTPRL